MLFFFYLKQKFPQKKFVLNDLNWRLILTYKIVRDNPLSLIQLLRWYQNKYYSLSDEYSRKEFYLHHRERFNQGGSDEVETAALFILLNKTGYNGLYRENGKGIYNVPSGKRAHPLIYDEESLMVDSRLLKDVILLNGSYEITKTYAGEKSFFYFDPPYKPISSTSSFNSYTSQKFDDIEQNRLHEYCNILNSLGACWMMSNSDVAAYNPNDDFFNKLYQEYFISQIPNVVRGMGTRDKKINELIITNYQIK